MAESMVVTPLGAALAAHPRIAVLVPCHNEAASIGSLVRSFHEHLPEAVVYVYDNASTDSTARLAANAGASVRFEPRLGKGNVLRRMFADIDADVYLMVDGDGTYDPSVAPEMVRQVVVEGVDMVVGARVPASDDPTVFRPGHTQGNAVFTKLVQLLFGGEFTDVFSGYRAFSKRFVKSIPVSSSGFEVETELSTHAVRIHAVCAELPTAYGSRPEDSASKLRTFRDGLRILSTMVRLFEEMRPLQFFGICFAALTVISLLFGLPILDHLATHGSVHWFPLGVVAAVLQTIAFVCLGAGIVLRSVGRARNEQRRLAYLQHPAPISEPAGGYPIADVRIDAHPTVIHQAARHKR